MNGPVTFSSWEGRAYQIQLHNGEVYLDYADGHDFQWRKQWIGVVVGFLVAAISLTGLGLELRFLRDPDTARRAGEASSCLGIFSLV